jgi:hypothetical protein
MKKLVVLILVVTLVAFVTVSFAKVAEPNKPDANKPVKDPNAPKANISINLVKGVCPNTPDANKPAKDPNAPKANIVLRLSVEPNAPAQKEGAISIRGRLVVTKDANGVITSVKVESRKTGTTNIVLDAKGKELAEKMAGKPVEVTGVESTKGSEKWLTVEKYAEMQRPGPGGPGGPGGKGPHGPNSPPAGGK